jgi:hypothetical protein
VLAVIFDHANRYQKRQSTVLNPWAQDELNDTKLIIRISKSNDRQHSGQRKKDKRTNNDLQTSHRTKDGVTRTPLKTGDQFLQASLVIKTHKKPFKEQQRHQTGEAVNDSCYQENGVWILLTILTKPLTFLTSLKLGRGLPSTYGLDCFVATGVGTVYIFRGTWVIHCFSRLVTLLFLKWFLVRFNHQRRL